MHMQPRKRQKIDDANFSESNSSTSDSEESGSEVSTSGEPGAESTVVSIYWSRIYRSVDNYFELFGNESYDYNVHISQGELGSLGFAKEEEYLLVPFSHFVEGGALFEMEAQDDDMLLCTPKTHQSGTGILTLYPPDELVVTDKLLGGNLVIRRVLFDSNNTNKYLRKQLLDLAEQGVELIDIPNIQKIYDMYFEEELTLNLIMPEKNSNYTPRYKLFSEDKNSNQNGKKEPINLDSAVRN
jgi:hypothetical protein